MSVLSSLFNAGAIIVTTSAKVVLVTTRVAVVSTVTTSAAVAAVVVHEAKTAAKEIQADPNIKAGIEASKSVFAESRSYVQRKVTSIETAAIDFEARHKE